MVAKIGAKAPNLQISRWVQGKPTNIDKEKGNVVLVEVFQVNCPGCFLYGIPEAIDIYKKYKDQGLTVLGMATAFEDYDKNTLENLQKLVMTGEVIGETYRALAQYGQLMDGNKIPYKIPFPVGMDMLKKESGQMMTDSKVMDFIEANIPDFRSYSEKDRHLLVERVKQYLRSKEYSAKTFEEYALRGTPSSILVDRKGILRSTFFGSNGFLEGAVEELLKE
ncbi:alkyl hydroperoxide reductase [Candidatus Nitrososphaera gargensis Ga9.2]|uniref:Alkyl hydroperoxide reductase n=1 Tax=Nitrososphaera gargensis (strain Ga9.2) TaxID=1237085 RepID=K0IFR8_NITGG|nr:redoxin domain-containing protein [Candidatus Nitrososphaera gargensis]AFU58660.1 alkyl hydroperoxide reductase [Candidatus Nitrososphaera gargensis Ga9.2]